MNAQTVGVKLETLRDRPYSIAVAGTGAKAEAIIGACNGGYVNVLIADEGAAELILSRQYTQPKH